MADACGITAKSWNSAFTTETDAGDTIGATRVDLLGADFLVAVPTVNTGDSKLLIKGY